MRVLRSPLVALGLLLVPACLGGGAPPAATPVAPEGAELPAPVESPATSQTPAPPAAQAPRPDSPLASADLAPRATLFGNPDRATPRLSPDGRKLSFLAPVDGVMNLWVGPADDLSAARPVTSDTTSGIRTYYWTYGKDQIVFLQDHDGDENFHVFRVDLAKGDVRDITPVGDTPVRAMIREINPKRPGEIAIAANVRDPKWHDLYRVDLATGAATRVVDNDVQLAFLYADADLRGAAATRSTDDGGTEVLVPDGKGAWKVVYAFSRDDAWTSDVIDVDAAGKTIYLVSSVGREKAALLALDVATGKTRVMATDAVADVGGAMVNPVDKRLEAAKIERERKRWAAIDHAIGKDFAALAKVAPGDVDVVSRTVDDRRWLVGYSNDDHPTSYYLYDRKTHRAHKVLTANTALDGLALAHMHPVVITSRDGLDLVSYLSLPRDADADGDGKPDHPLPMVLLVHGGPWGRDSWGLDPFHQWLASRGYAVLSVNFRGSTGFGKAFVNAGDHEWGVKMQNDLIDAVDWAVRGGVAEPGKVAIMGGSYGGYAVLAGLAFTPDEFACGVDLFGPANLETLLASIPPYWASLRAMFAQRIGDPDTDEGRALLGARSPVHKAGQIQRPLLIGQGANDVRVRRAESDQIVEAMKAAGIPVTYLVFGDEGHGFERAANNIAFAGVAEAFLSDCLGGRYQPIGGDFAGSSIEVVTGGEHVSGLGDAAAALGK